MSAPLDELYFQWLYEQVADPDFQDKELTYWKIFRILYTKEFIWIVANDENRIGDGIALRRKFVESQGILHIDPHWMDMGCSFLELMVGLSIRLEFLADEGRAHYWFWVLMENIGLSGYHDKRRFTERLTERIDDILNDVIYRNYNKSGLGGFFPLQSPNCDQREQEIWDQMEHYIMEQSLAA